MTRQAELRSKLPAMDSDDFVVSFGRIRDMATELGELVQLYQRIMGRKGQKLSPEENERLMASGVKMMSWLPEIAGFEDTPAEISCLQTGMIAKAFGLDSAATSRVEEITRDHFAQMKTTGATAASRERPGWREQRTAAISQLMWKLRPILPPNSQLISSLPTMLNLGAGMEEQVDVKIDAKGESHGTISMSLPTWPAVPWLPRK
jgi:hypothetical protein